MTPETPVAHVDSPTEVQPAEDNVQKLEDWKSQDRAKKEERKAQKMTKLQEKQVKAHMERRQRLINKGVPKEKVDMYIAQEDYEKMPLEKKVKRLEQIIQGTFQNFALELHNLRYNDGVLADSMDLNFKAFAKMLVKMGMPLEDHRAFIEEAQREIIEERGKVAEAAAAEAKARTEKEMADNEKKVAEEALKAAETAVGGVDANGSPIVPPEATQFGG